MSLLGYDELVGIYRLMRGVCVLFSFEIKEDLAMPWNTTKPKANSRPKCEEFGPRVKTYLNPLVSNVP